MCKVELSICFQNVPLLLHDRQLALQASQFRLFSAFLTRLQSLALHLIAPPPFVNQASGEIQIALDLGDAATPFRCHRQHVPFEFLAVLLLASNFPLLTLSLTDISSVR